MQPEWRWWTVGHESVRSLGDAAVASPTTKVVVPSTGSVVTVPVEQLIDIGARPWTAVELTWRAAAGRAISATAETGAPARVSGAFEPLPHQLVALERAMHCNPVRLLFADEVGLGKTIEAGLVITELLARGRIQRVLIVAPKGVQLQWVSEMQLHFDLEFVRVGAEGIPVDAGIDPWKTFDRVVCSLDSVKPLGAREGWEPERLDAYNQLRFDAVVGAGWDLVIFDEAHHVAGSTEEVARHQLAVALAAECPHVLLLSATPHSGKSDAFARLMGLLDPRFVKGLPVERATVAPLVVRSDKRSTTDGRGKPLFQPRTTQMHVVPYGPRDVERQLYEAVTEYVRHGYKRAQVEKRPAVGFLVLLMQRLASSSTAALLAALHRRHAAVLTEGTQLRLFPMGAEEWGDLSGEDQVEALDAALGAAWGDELAEVELLIDLARRASTGTDAKAKAMLELLDRLAAAESNPSLKAVVFTEFAQTQQMLLDLFESVGIDAVAINGKLGVHERSAVQQEFRDRARVLVSTDAGGEGVNLQFAHVVISYDLPWSPSKIEQRIGRVDRIGQSHPVQAVNMAMEQSIDARVLEVLDRKLRVIQSELGVDKSGDILESADRHADSLYIAAILDENTDAAEDDFERSTRSDVSASASFTEMIDLAAEKPSIGKGPDPRQWIEVAMRARQVAGLPPCEPDAVLRHLPEVSPQEPIPVVPGSREGIWTLWEVGASDGRRTCNPIFLTAEGANRPDIADRVWDELVAGTAIVGTADPLGEDQWRDLWSAGWDYSARPSDSAMDGDGPSGLLLRLLVRVCP